MSENKEVQKRETALDFAKRAEALNYTGFENVDDSMISLPFLKIAQPTSPEAMKGSDAYVDGLEAGMFWNSVARKPYGNSVQIVLLGYDRSFIEWAPEGGFIGRFTVDEIQTQKNLGAVTDDGKGNFLRRIDNQVKPNEIRDTSSFFVMLPEHAEDGIMIFSFKGTGLKHVRKWLTRARALKMKTPAGMVPAPMFSVVWAVKTVLNHNDQGNWYLIGDAKHVAADPVGNVTEDKLKDMQAVVFEAAQFVKETQFKVNVQGAQTADDGIPI